MALKLIAPRLVEDVEFRERFVRESRLTASIDHPNVIPVFKASEVEGSLFLAMRWVEGTDLGALIKGLGRLEPERAVGIVTQVAAALDAAHARGLVHRDVKPANVLVGAGDHIYLTDFGLTKRASSDSGLTSPGAFVGTVDYAAPEQVSESAAVDARTDVYALACVGYHALSGQVPFVRESVAAKMFAQLNDEPPPVSRVTPGISPVLDDVLRRALAKDPGDRYPSAGDLGRAMLAALEGGSVSQPERSIASGTARPAAGSHGTDVTTPLLDSVAKPEQRTLRRTLVAGVLLALLALTTALVGTRLRANGSGSDTIRLAGEPGEVSVAGGKVWITNTATDSVVRLDTRSARTIGRPIPVGHDPQDVAASEGGVWVANFQDDTVTRIDMRTGRADTPVRVGDGPFGLAVGARRLWVVHTRDGTLRQIDARAGSPVGKPLRIGRRPRDVAVEEGAVWVADAAGALYRIDPAHVRRRPVRIDLPLSPEGLAISEQRIWVSSFENDAVIRVDSASNRIVGKPLRVGKGPEGMAVGAGSIWVTNFRSDTVSKIDARTGQVSKPIAVGKSPAGIGLGGGSVWVANFDDGTVTRLGL